MIPLHHFRQDLQMTLSNLAGPHPNPSTPGYLQNTDNGAPVIPIDEQDMATEACMSTAPPSASTVAEPEAIVQNSIMARTPVYQVLLLLSIRASTRCIRLSEVITTCSTTKMLYISRYLMMRCLRWCYIWTGVSWWGVCVDAIYEHVFNEEVCELMQYINRCLMRRCVRWCYIWTGV